MGFRPAVYGGPHGTPYRLAPESLQNVNHGFAFRDLGSSQLSNAYGGKYVSACEFRNQNDRKN